ncbi:MAG: hypothetical protein ACREPA_11805 [Candidatus Dormibacteraceae bacterium]
MRSVVRLLSLPACLLATSMALAGCGGGQVQTDDAGFHADVTGNRAGQEVTFHATEVAPPRYVGDHEVLLVRASTGETVEVDYNTSLGPQVPAADGDHLVIQGVLYIDPGRVGVHCVHAHTSRGCPLPGFVILKGQAYQ